MAFQYVHVEGGGSSTGNGKSYTVDALLNIALAEEGYKEKKTNSNLDSKTANAGSGEDNWTKYARDLDKISDFYNGAKNGYAWCDVFVDWCFYQLCNKDANKARELICQPKKSSGAGCTYSYAYYKNNKRAGTKPVKGAQIFFGSSTKDIDHTGLVYKYDDKKVYTIEGNTSDAVKKREYSRSNSTIVGYGYPKLTGLYMPGESAPPEDPTPTNPEPTDPTPTPTDNYNGLKYSDSNPPLYCKQTTNKCYKNTTTMTIKGVLWHSTGCNNPNIKRYVQPSDNASDKQYWLDLLGKNQYKNDWNHSGDSLGMNCWVGKLADGSVTTVQTMPWNYKPWGCGSGSKGSCNNGWIQFEICEDNLKSEEYFNACYTEACQITAYLCKKYNLDPKGTVTYNGVKVPVILDHKTSCSLKLGSNHGDIGHWFPKYGKSMETVRNDVAALLQSSRDGDYIPVIKSGDIVTVAINAVSEDGQKVQSYITTNKWKVKSSEEGSEYATLGERADTSTVVLNKSYKKLDLTVTSADGTAPPSPNTGTVTNEERIWNLLSAKVKDDSGKTNAYGVAGIMGNMMAESGLKPKNLQNSYEKKLTGKSGTEADDHYTAAVDNGTYTNFVRDSAGYGLVQWTFWSLKEGLLEYAQKHKKSIGDLDMQVEFLCHQLSTGYKSVWKTCCNAKSVKEASNKMLHGFERPAGHDDGGSQQAAHEKKRADFGQGFLEKHKNACTHSNTSTKDAVEASCSSDGYTGDTVCTSCGQTVQYGQIIPAKQHNFVNGVCTVCGGTPGSTVDPTSPGHNCIVTREYLVEMLELLNDMLKRGGE